MMIPSIAASTSGGAIPFLVTIRPFHTPAQAARPGDTVGISRFQKTLERNVGLLLIVSGAYMLNHYSSYPA
jgi:hypothetical protein